jgi:hypothetical protein
MKNIQINNQKLHELYIQEIHRISADLEGKGFFTTEDLVSIVSSVLEKNPDLIEEIGPTL